MPRPSASAVLLSVLLASPALAGAVGLALAQGSGPAAALAAAFVLVLVPILGLSALLGSRRGALPIASALWSAAILLGLPVFGPLPRARAVADGAALFVGAPAPDAARDLRERAPPLEVAPAPSEREPVVVAPALASEDPGPGADQEPELAASITLPFEGGGRRLRVPVRLEGPRGPLDVWMLFDTGATFTTLDRATLGALGLRVPKDAPSVDLDTAAGPVTSRLVLLDRIYLEGTPVEGVTVATCEACATDRYVGLLGLNVTGRYQSTLDHDGGEIVLAPGPVEDRTVDIARWLELDGSARIPARGPVQLEVVARNRSDRRVLEAVTEVSCRESSFAVQLDDLPPHGERRSSVELPPGTDCRRFQVRLLHARW